MNHSWKTGLGAAGIALLALTGCGDSADADPEPTEAETEEDAESPSPSPTAADDVEAADDEDEWLAAVREAHLDDLVDWYAEYFERDCDAGEPECYDHFAEGIEPMEAFADDIRNEVFGERPDYVSFRFPGDAAIAARTMEAWYYACPDRADCADAAADAHERVTDVLSAAIEWSDDS